MSEDMRIGRGFSSAFRVYTNDVHNVPSVIWTRIHMGGAVDFDLLDEIDNILWQFTPQEAGYYLFLASVSFVNLNVGDEIGIEITRNLVGQGATHKTMAGAIRTSILVQCLLYVTPADTVYVQGYHNFGAPRLVTNGFLETRFEGFRMK